MKKKLFLIDGTALIYRAYFAFIRNPLYTRDGFNTSAMFGTFNMFLSFIERYDPEYLLISFDKKGKTFRHKLDDNYKQNRPPAPPEMIEQLEPINEFFRLAGVAECSLEGFEADDVIVSAARRFEHEFEVVIVSGDKDFAQVVNDNIMLYDPKKNVVIKREQVMEKFGVTPEQFIDYLAICGDSADNIPGVKGIGAKGAAKLLGEYGSLDGIYEHLEEIKSKSMKAKLIENKDNAYLSQKLAAIVSDLPLGLDIANLKFNRAHLQRTAGLLHKYELHTLASKVEPAEQDIFDILGMDSEEKESAFKAELVDNIDALDKMIKEIGSAEELAIDTETTSTDALTAELVGISLCCDDSRAYYIAIAHSMADNVELEQVLPKLQELLADKLLIAHNYKYDYQVLTAAGFELKNKVFDTMIADYLLHPDERHSLDNCARKYLDHEMIPITDLIGKGKKQITFDMVATGKACDYAAEDAWASWKLYKMLKPELLGNHLLNLFEQIEIPLLFTLAEMERKGVHIDQKSLRLLGQQVEERIGILTQKIYKISEIQFNLNSPKQLGEILFEKLSIPPVKKTKTGYSTDQSVLEKLAEDHEIAKHILEYRTLSKLLTTYIKALPALINERTGRIHSSFNQTVAATGRLSSSNPNLQNIPVRTRLGKEVRKAFCAENEDWCIVAADYSQIELRVFAILTRDETLIDTFKAGRDIHSKTASLIYNVPEAEVSSDMRRYAKVINFGLLYGMGAFRISNELNVTRKEAQIFIDDYFANFPTVRDYIDKHLELATHLGYVKTLLGRKLYLPDLNSRNHQRKEAAKRVAVNMPVQGSAADLIKIAMNKLHELLRGRDDIRMLIQVHDELVFEVKKSVLEEAKALIKDIMENSLPAVFKDVVPLKVDIGVGSNWFEAH